MKALILLLTALLITVSAVSFLSTQPAKVSEAHRAPGASEISVSAHPHPTESAAGLAGNSSTTPITAAPSLIRAMATPAASDTKSSDFSDPTSADRPVALSATTAGVPLTPPTSSPTVSSDNPSVEDIEYEIPAGMRAPVVFLPEERPLTPPMQRFLDDVRREFDAAIAAADNPADVWEEARQQADDRYRLLFGDEAYNRKTMSEAIEALRSKGALPTPPQKVSTPVIPEP